MTVTAITPPGCFGHLWAPTAVECKGGLDPGYTNPTNQSNKRDQCQWYSSCATRTAATRLSANQPPPVPQQIIPTNRLMPPAPVAYQPGPGRPVQVQPGYSQQQQSYYHPAPPNPVPYGNIPQVPIHQAWYGPTHVPMAYQLPGAQMPSYLAVPEPVTSGTTWWGRLLLEALRAMMKAAFHQGSHYVDHRSITKPREPIQVVQPPPT